MCRTEAFTLVELIIVVIIISVLAAMIIPRFVGRSEDARKEVAMADINVNIATALKLYEVDNGVFPNTEEGLKALLKPLSSAKNWKGPYLEKKPLDPWSNPYNYKCPGVHRPYDYDLFSFGKDGIEGTDDLCNWEED
ncbi:MAG: type II secretion system protein GspG [Candidatus Omnitrophota bacterium]|nr:MAG: type II secretion system protein GspG [Candidatus Omnitrophota bacterium]